MARVVMVRRVVRIFAEFDMAVRWVVVGGADNDYRMIYLWSMLAYYILYLLLIY